VCVAPEWWIRQSDSAARAISAGAVRRSVRASVSTTGARRPADVLADVERVHTHLSAPAGEHRFNPGLVDPVTFSVSTVPPAARRWKARRRPSAPRAVTRRRGPRGRGPRRRHEARARMIEALRRRRRRGRHNALVHERPPIELHAGSSPRLLVVAVRDSGRRPVDPYVGMVPAPMDGADAIGLYLGYRWCGDVVLEKRPDGFTVRLAGAGDVIAARPAQRPADARGVAQAIVSSPEIVGMQRSVRAGTRADVMSGFPRERPALQAPRWCSLLPRTLRSLAPKGRTGGRASPLRPGGRPEAYRPGLHRLRGDRPPCLSSVRTGNVSRMAKTNLFKTLRKHGVRTKVARAVADAERGGKDAEAVARDALADLSRASDAIRSRVTEPAARRRAGAKGAATRKRKAAKRSEAAKRAAQTRKAMAKSR
jgi:hypothetical protein